MKTKFIFMLFLSLFLWPGCQTTADIPPAMSMYGADADLIFRGTIRILHTSTIDAADPESMGVVHVTEVIKQSDRFPNMAGRDVTVLFREIQSMRTGADLIFFTRLNHMGKEIALTELGHMMPDETRYPTARLKTQAAEVMQQAQADSLKALVRAADVIVSGRITKTVLLPASNRDSEHDPMWTEAVLQVSETIKGKAEAVQTFVFAGSIDVAWYRSPKLKEGDEGTFLLRQDVQNEKLRGRLVLLDRSGWQTDKANIEAIRKYAKQ